MKKKALGLLLLMVALVVAFGFKSNPLQEDGPVEQIKVDEIQEEYISLGVEFESLDYYRSIDNGEILFLPGSGGGRALLEFHGNNAIKAGTNKKK